MRLLLSICFVSTGLVLSPMTSSAASVDETLASTRAELKAALQELSAAQEAIGQEKIPLAKRLNTLEEELAAKRKALERNRRDQENQLVDLNVLKARVKHQRDEHAYLQGLLSEYARHFETRIHISEVARFAEPLATATRAPADADLTPAEKAARQVALLETGLSRLDQLLGGNVFEGNALVAGGKLEPGQFALVGPLAFFSSTASDEAGIAELQLGSAEPTVVTLDPAQASQIQALLQAGSGEAPIDPTSGNALKIAAQDETLWEHIRKGGPVMVPILLLGLAALAICLVKWIQLARIRVATHRDLEIILDHLEENRPDLARAHAAGITGPVGEMLAAALNHIGESKEYLEEVMYEKMLSTKPRLERLLPVIALSAATAPLLGLLGTVTGMINTFNMITVFGTGDPRTLASGISEALITTEYGLVVAVPSLLFHAFISRKAKGVMGSMEQTAVGLINGIPSPEEKSGVYA